MNLPVPYVRPSCFDPRLRDGGDPSKSGSVAVGEVSIHASVMEATSPLPI